MKRILCTVLFAIVLAAPAWAKAYKIPESGTLVTVTVPDEGWEVNQIDRGIEVNSEDEEVYLAVEGITSDNTAEVMTAAFSYLERQGVKIDKASETKKEGSLNGLPALDFGWKGTDKDGDVLIHLTLVKLAAGKAVMFTYWASVDGDKQHDAELGKILQSLKPV